MLKNEILLPGVHNSRELGGYPAGGRIVKKGVLIRTAELIGATPEAKLKKNLISPLINLKILKRLKRIHLVMLKILLILFF